MEKRILLLAKLFAWMLLAVFSVRAVDEFLPCNPMETQVAEFVVESDYSRNYYYVKSVSNHVFQIDKDHGNISVGDRMQIYTTTIFNEIVAWKTANLKGNKHEAGSTVRPLLGSLSVDIIVVCLSCLSLFFAQRFEHKIAPLIFALVFASVRWWFFPES